MKSKIVISATNKKAIEAIRKLQDKKKKLQQMMAQDKPLSSLKTRAVPNRRNEYESIMENLLYVIAFILMVIWAFGYIGFQAGNLIHLVIVLAIIAVLFRLLQRRTL